MSKICFYLSLVFLIISQSACDSIEIVSPPGPSGKSNYEIWVEAVNNKEINWTLGTDVANYFKYIKGEKGDSGKDAYLIWKEWIKDGSVDNPHKPNEKWSPANDTKRHFYLFLSGAKGENGLTPFINQKGNWQIGDVDTNIPARGEKGDKGDKGDTGSKGDKGDNGTNGAPGAKGEKGDKGDKGEKGDPGQNGQKGDKGDAGLKGDKGDTGEKGAPGQNGQKGQDGQKGEKGKDGRTPIIKIINGTWHIDGVDTHVNATGPKGDKGDKGDQGQAGGSGGSAGKSAYEIWKEEVNKGTIKYDVTQIWPQGKTDLNHFWFYIQGKDPEGNGGGNGGGNNNVNLEQTKIEVFVFTEFIIGGGGVYDCTIQVNTDPNATVYFHSYGDPGPPSVETVVADNTGVATINKVNGEAFKTDLFDKRTFNIWSKAPGKLQSPHIHVMPATSVPS